MPKPENMTRPQMEPEFTGSEFKVLKVKVPGGAQMPTHHATSEAVICVRSGKAQIKMSGETTKLSAGDAFMLPSGEDHSLKIIEEFKAHVVMEADAGIEFE